MATFLQTLYFNASALLLSNLPMGEVCLYAREGSMNRRAGLF